MPPASRGALLRVRLHKTRLISYRDVSTATSHAPPKFPARTRTRRPPESISGPSRTESAVKYGSEPLKRRRRTFRRLMPGWLQNQPFLRSLIFSAMITVPISAFALMHVPFQLSRVTGPSMKPTINADCESERDTNYNPTWVLVRNSKFDPNYRRDLERRASEKGQSFTGTWARGDIVVYNTPHDPEKIAVKRVVGIAGDSVIPLPGYNGGEEPVVVPYNHLWVEGDANDRKKSVDSNYFGPISKALVQGRVVAMWSPWWNVFGIRRLSSDVDSWPARRQKRVVEDAVHDASAHPDTVDSVRPFEGQRGDNLLRLIREHPQTIEERFKGDEIDRNKIVQLYTHAYKIAKYHPDAGMQQRAQEIGKEFERIIGRNALREAAKPQKQRRRRRARGELDEQPFDDVKLDIEQMFSGAIAHEDERAAEREVRAAPAKAALEEMLKQKRQYGEMIDKEFEERDKVREAREL